MAHITWLHEDIQREELPQFSLATRYGVQLLQAYESCAQPSTDRVTEGLPCKPERLGEGSRIVKSPKVVGRGCKRSFGPTAQRSPKSLLHHVQPCFAPVQPQVALVQEALRSLGPKDLLHPLITTFGDLPVVNPLSQALWFASPTAIFLRGVAACRATPRERVPSRGGGVLSQTSCLGRGYRAAWGYRSNTTAFRGGMGH